MMAYHFLDFTLGRLGPSMVAACLVFGMSGPSFASDTECVRTSLVQDDPGRSVTGKPLTNPEVIGSNLRLRVQVPRAMVGTLTLIAADGEPTASESLDLLAYETTLVDLEHGLGELDAKGFQYRLELVDETTGVPVTVEDVPLRIGFACSSPDDCVPTARLGVSSTGPVTQEGFADALEEARELGSDDLLGYVLDVYPELAASVYETAFHHDPPAEDTLQQDADTAPCACRWIGGFGSTSHTVPGVQPGTRELGGFWDDGVRGFWAGQTIDGTIADSIPSAHATLALQLVCSRFEGRYTRSREVLEVDLLDPVRIPVLASCAPPCEAEIEHRVETTVCAEARSYGGAGQGASADLRLDVLFRLDGQDRFGASAWVDPAVGPTGADRQLSRAGKNKTYRVIGHRSEGSTWMEGSYRATAARQPLSQGGSYTYAAASTTFTQEIVGKAVCASDMELSFVDGGSGGGEVLMRWGDPPS